MHYLTGARALRVFLCFAAAYLLSYAFRAINAVIAPALMQDIGLSNGDLGLLSSAYFMAFAAMQLPLGIWLDRYGARRTEAGLLLFAAAGAALFASSSSFTGLWLGRAMIGAGVAGCLMAPFKAYRIWFAPQRQSQLASWMLMAGTSGVLLTTVPVSAMLPVLGWRGIFWIMSGLILLAALAIFTLLREVEASIPLPPVLPAHSVIDGSPATDDSYRRIFKDPYFQRMAILGTVNQGIFIALQTLWAGPWMMTVLALTRAQTAQVLLAFNLMLLLSYLALGWWAPRYVAQHSGESGWPLPRTVAWGLLGTLVMQVGIVSSSASWAWLFWLGLALFATVNTLVQTNVSMSFPAQLAGRANTAFNLLLFSGAFVAQWGIGVMIDLFQHLGFAAELAMRGAFGVCLILQTVALLFFYKNPSQFQKLPC